MIATLKVIQWNIKGYMNNYNELQILIKKLNPQIICLQETHLHTANSVPIPINFEIYISSAQHNSFGGAAILIHNSIPHQISNNSPNDYDIVNILVQSKLKFKITSAYIPPKKPFSIKTPRYFSTHTIAPTHLWRL